MHLLVLIAILVYHRGVLSLLLGVYRWVSPELLEGHIVYASEVEDVPNLLLVFPHQLAMGLHELAQVVRVIRMVAVDG